MFYCKIMTIYLIITLCSITQAAYTSRMATVSRMRGPAVFRPGVTLPRPWPRLVPAASNRIPFVVYRNPPNKYVMKHIPHNNVNLPLWKKPRLPLIVQPSLPLDQELEFVRAAPVVQNGGTGAIHTIPAPNLSLAEKPIVVVDIKDTSDAKRQSEAPNQTYEVTEKVPEIHQMAKVETPAGFSKSNSLTAQELETLINSASAFQVLPEYNSQIMIPQQYIPIGFKTIQPDQGIISATEPVLISQKTIIQPETNWFQTIHSQLQHYPQLSPIEFIPFIPDVPTSNPIENPEQAPNEQPKTITQDQLLLLTNEEIKTQDSPSDEAKTIVQRDTQESSILTLVPQPFTTTENVIDTTDNKPNVTEKLSTELQEKTTIKYLAESTTEPLPSNVTPIYYAQVGQSIGNVIANGFYSAINDVRAAAALAQVEKSEETKPKNATQLSSDLQTYIVQNKLENKTGNEIKHMLGTPFAKTADSVKVAYTLVRTEEKDPKVSKEGTVYAGQIVEASISEDTDFNKEKVSLIQRRTPVRFVATKQNDRDSSLSDIVSKVSVVKAKIPPKSTLLFDEKTGEPILRIYASYSDSPTQKEIITSKLSSLKRGNGGVKKEFYDAWSNADAKSSDPNYETQFGLKIKDRSDDYIPLYEDYE